MHAETGQALETGIVIRFTIREERHARQWCRLACSAFRIGTGQVMEDGAIPVIQ